MSKYIVIPREGYYSDTLKVASSHNTAKAALKAALVWDGYRVIGGSDKRKGDEISRGVLADMINAGHWYHVTKNNHPNR